MKNLLSIGYAKRVLQTGSREQERQLALAQGVAQHVMIVFTKQSDALPAEFRKDNLTVLGTNARTKLGMLWRAWRLGRSVLRRSGETSWIVSAQDPFATSLVAWPLSWARHTTFHVQLHGDNFGNPAWREARLAHWFLYYIGVCMLRRAVKIRVVAKRQQRALTALAIPAERIVALPVFIDVAQFLEIATYRTAPEASMTLRVLYAGRFSEEKQLVTVLEAVQRAADTGVPIHLTLLGEGSEVSTLKAFVAEQQLQTAVTFMPWSNDVAAEFARHDVFVLNSAHEGFALVLLEAMAARLPVVTTDVGCVGELVLHNQHGLVTDGSPAAIAAAFTRLQDTALRQRYGVAGRKTAAASSMSIAAYRKAWAQSF